MLGNQFGLLCIVCNLFCFRFLQIAYVLNTTVCNQFEGVTVFSGCSGSGCPESSLERLGQPDYFPGFNIEVLAQCDNDVATQKWLQALFPDCPVLFNSMEVVSQSAGINLKDLLGERVNIPTAMIFICGFVCKSVSSLNPKAATFKDVCKYMLHGMN